MTTPILLSPNPLNDDQLDCVEKVAEVLELAKAGEIFTVGIVVCMKKGFATTIGGTDAGSLNLGLDAMKVRILERVTDEGVKRGGVSRITRVT
jgi:hypothetical protein